MSSRERWTVYPLLFLTLGIALKDKVMRSVDIDQLMCRRLVVTDQLGNSQVVIGATPQGIVDADQVMCRRLVVTDQLGNSQVVLGATPQGGLATMEGVRRGVAVSVGHFSNQVSGLLITDGNRKPIQGLLVPSTAQATTPRDRRGKATPFAAPRGDSDPADDSNPDKAVE